VFVRQKPNKSGVVSVQIIDKSSGKYEVYRTVGSSSDKNTIATLVSKAKLEIIEYSKQSSLPFSQSLEADYINTLIENIESFSLVGPELLLGKIFDEIGFNAIQDILFRHLVITRFLSCAAAKKKSKFCSTTPINTRFVFLAWVSLLGLRDMLYL
jgi:hypothetical protein